MLLLFQVFAQETRTAERFRSDDATVHITLFDVNDNSPVFTQSTMYRFHVNVSVQSDTMIGQVGGI